MEPNKEEDIQATSLAPIWFWKETRGHLVGNDLPIWKKFQPHLNKLIESAFSLQQPHFTTRNFKIDFQVLSMETTNDKDELISFPLERRLENLILQDSEDDDDRRDKDEMLEYAPMILGEWYKRNLDKMYALTYIEKLKYALEASQKGILAKGDQLREEKDARDFSSRLVRNMKEDDPEKLLEEVVKAYTSESFLYKEANKFLRECNQDDVDVLGPFCYILNEYLCLAEMKAVEDLTLENKRQIAPIFQGILYRGMQLSPEKFLEVFPSDQKIVRLTGFNSCTPDKRIAHGFVGKMKEHSIKMKNESSRTSEGSRAPAPLRKKNESSRTSEGSRAPAPIRKENESSRTSEGSRAPDPIQKENEYVFLEIEIPGNKGVFIRNISRLSKFPLEDEVLLPPGSILQIKDHWIDSNQIHILKGILLPNKQAEYNLTVLTEYFFNPKNEQIRLKILNNYVNTSKTPSLLQTIKKFFTKSEDHEKVSWYWKANQDPWSEQEEAIWTKYAKTDIIEKAYRSGQDGVQVDHYYINFEVMIQINTRNQNGIRPVRRNDPRREKMRKTLLYESVGKYLCPFIVSWQAHFLEEFGAPIFKHTKVLVDLIYLGLLEEAKTQNNVSKGQIMADQLKREAQACNYDIEGVFKRLTYLYTQPTFFYATINKALRENDSKKADTLGAFCLLFNELVTYFDTIKKYPYSGTVWRGTLIDEALLNTYFPDKEPYIYWTAFSSTSKDREVAEMFMVNVLFEIRLYDKGVDVEQLSAVDSEREVLIHSGSVFRVLDHKFIGQVHHIVLSSQAY